MRLAHVMLYVQDFQRALRWYQDVLGFRADFVEGNDYGSLRHPQGGAQIDLHHASAGETPSRSAVVYFEVAGLDGLVSDLRAKGVAVRGPRQVEGSPRFADFVDSEGNRLGVEEARAR